MVKKEKSIIEKDMEKENKEEIKIKKENERLNPEEFPTLKIKLESEIALDFATKVYERFNKMIKSVILFGSSAKKTSTASSDIDLIILIDDCSIKWDDELISWYREELDKLLRKNPYQKVLHINTIKLSTWWEDLMIGDPVIINVLRNGEEVIDFGGFFTPLKFLLLNGKIKSTPEAIYNCLERTSFHLLRSKTSELGSIEGLYWAMVDASHAALISAGVSPASPELIPLDLKEIFVDSKKLNMKYVNWYRDLLILHKKISHKEINDLKGVEIDDWQEKTQEFIRVMAELVNKNLENKK
jgi:predicted nucleotidyltransferase